MNTRSLAPQWKYGFCTPKLNISCQLWCCTVLYLGKPQVIKTLETLMRHVKSSASPRQWNPMSWVTRKEAELSTDFPTFPSCKWSALHHFASSFHQWLWILFLKTYSIDCRLAHGFRFTVMERFFTTPNISIFDVVCPRDI